MRQILTVFFLLYFSTSFGQGINKAFIDRWLKLCDDNIPVDSVKAYYIDRQYFTDTAKINAYLKKIPPGKIRSIRYSKTKKCNYVPGRGSIHIMTIEKMDSEDVKTWLKEARKLYRGKDPVLVIDGLAVSMTISKATLYNIAPEEIYDISVNGFFPVPASLFGQNAKNGLVLLWTKQKYKE